MKCKNCGAGITSGMIECEYCGSVIDITAAGDTAAAVHTISQQSWTALLTAEERQTLLSYLETNKRILAIKFVVSRLGLSMEQGTEMIEQLEAHKEVCIPDVDTLMALLTSKSNNVLYFDENEDRITKAKRGAMNKYLLKLGYTPNEKILLLYDNAAIKTGESGFTITDRGFYSSGFFLEDKEFFLSLNDFKTVELVDTNRMVINGKKVDIIMIHNDDYYNLCAIVAGIIRTNR